MIVSGHSQLPAEIATACRFFPVLDHLALHLEREGILEDARLGWHCHLTWLTALAVQALLSGGAEVMLSECNPRTTESDAVEFMESLGVKVFLGPESTHRVISAEPIVLSDTGFELTSRWLAEPRGKLAGACEITTSGITRLRQLSDLPLPVVNINDGQLKTLIENFHGVGDGVVDGLFRLTGKMWAGRAVAVAGYGRVGAGVAHYLKRLGANVSIVEVDPVRRLVAHYDGFSLCCLRDAMAGSELVVTATGRHGLLGREQWLWARDGLLVFNVGHWRQEVSPEDLRALSVGQANVSEHLEEFTLPGAYGKQKKVLLAAGGSPANVVLLSGSPEPTLIHLTTEILCLSFLVQAGRDGISLPAGETAIPHQVEHQSSVIALAALGLHEDVNESSELVSRDRTC